MDDKSDATNSERPIIIQLAKEMTSTSDADQFCFKALKHVCFLLEAERCNLYRVQQSGQNDSTKEELVSRLSGINPQSSFKDVKVNKVSSASGVPSQVAKTRKPFEFAHRMGTSIETEESDQIVELNENTPTNLNSEIHSMLCYPIISEEKDILHGVVEVINKVISEDSSESNVFTSSDKEVLEHFLILCSLAITNSQKNKDISLLNHSKQFHLSLINELSNSWSSITSDDIIKSTMMQIISTIKCQRYTLAIKLFDNPLTNESTEEISVDHVTNLNRYFDIIRDENQEIDDIQITRLKKSDWVLEFQLVLDSLKTKKIKRVSEITELSPYYFEDSSKSFVLKNALCFPLYTGDQLMCVLLLSNKETGFTSEDEEIVKSMQGFLLCGVFFSNSINSYRMQTSRSQVYEEMIAYHLSNSHTPDITRLKVVQLKKNIDIYDFKFIDGCYSEDETLVISLKIFKDLDILNTFKIEENVMLRWLLTVKSSYRDVRYHNWRHGFNVAHTMALLLHFMKKDKNLPQLKEVFTLEESFCLIVACFCHDTDHRGTNNTFLIRSQSPLATLYSTSTLEHHHFDNFKRILSIKNCNIFSSFSDEKIKSMTQFIKQAILATDLGLYFQRRGKFNDMLKQLKPEKRDFHKDISKKRLLISMMMTACDLAQTTKPWEAQYQTARNVTSEFYDQGDLERKLFDTEPVPMMDRKQDGDIAKMQIGFIDGVCSLVYQMMKDTCSLFSPLHQGLIENRDEWVRRAEIRKNEQKSVESQKDDKQDIKGEKYESLWVKYWNADPENFIWGIDPNDEVPPVEIQRVVFSPKKKNGTPNLNEKRGKPFASSFRASMRKKNKNAQKQQDDVAMQVLTSQGNQATPSTSSSTSIQHGGSSSIGWPLANCHPKKKKNNKIDCDVTGDANTTSPQGREERNRRVQNRKISEIEVVATTTQRKSGKSCSVM